MKSIKLIVAFVAVLGLSRAHSQNSTGDKISQTPASDIPGGFTYDWDITKQLILDRIEHPAKENKDAQPLLDSPDFPAYKGKKIDDAFKKSLKEWMEKNSTLIINTLKHRKDIVTQY